MACEDCERWHSQESAGVGLYLMTLGRMTAWFGLSWPGLASPIVCVSLTDDGRYMIYGHGHGQGILVSCFLYFISIYLIVFCQGN